jgi:carboxypeptidase Q
MRRLGGIAVLLVAASSLDLARSSVARGRSLEYATQLTEIGPRVTGSRTYERAVEWSADQFRAMGITRVALEPFTIERGWERVAARARIAVPLERPLHVESLGWSPSTPDGGLDADVVALDTFSPDAATMRSLRGCIVLLPEGDPPGNPITAGKAITAFADRLRAAGAFAILLSDSEADNLLTARGLSFSTAISVLPAGQIGRDDARAIRELVGRGPVRISLELTNRITPGAATVNNVIAEIRGRDRPDEWVVVGAHLDSWDFATGAQDNATGVAMVLEAARAIAALPQPPRRSIRFALWGGEEQGQIGSTAYVRAHAFEQDRVVAYLNTDAGTGRTIGWTAPGRADVVRAARPLTRIILDELGAGTFDESLRYGFQSDGAPFILAGIPTLDLNSDDSQYEEIHHKATDTMDRVDVRNLALGAAAVAATAHAIAESAGRFAPHLDRRAVERNLKPR